MRACCILFCILLCSFVASSQSGPPIGQWREHLPYSNTIALELFRDKIWAATAFSVFSVDPSDQAIERYSKIGGLTGTNIRSLGKDVEGSRLIIIYADGMIDIIDEENIVHVTDIHSSRLVDLKTLNKVYSAAGNTWIAGSEAIYLLDAVKHEIRETYIIGGNGAKTNVSDLVVYNDSLFAATNEGLKAASLRAGNLADFRNWNLIIGNGLPPGTVAEVKVFDNRVMCRVEDSVYLRTGNTWSVFYSSASITSVTTTGSKLLVTQASPGNAAIAVIDVSGNVNNVFRNNDFLKKPVSAILLNDTYYTADSLLGLIAITTSSIDRIVPSSPGISAPQSLHSTSSKTIITGGGISESFEPLNLPAKLSVLSGNEWQNIDSGSYPSFKDIQDFVIAEIDPRDGSIWTGSFGDGLVHIENANSIRQYKQNSFIGESEFAPGAYRVTGLISDASNNLWIANHGAENNLLVLKPDGTTVAFIIPFPLPGKAVGQLLVDDLNQKWIIAPGGNGLVCFNHGQSLENPADDQWKWYRAGAGNGNLPSGNVLSITMDKDGFIWIGTDAGIGIIRCSQDIFSQAGCDAFLPVVQQDNFAGFLFSGERVQAIAVDGANRKWVGTRNGLWLISADGEKIIHRFTSDNSPLLDNHINGISIDPVTGEVFIATSKGLCSFRGTATEGKATSSNILVFPNPVPPGYTGTIAIRGVANNAIVKITELNGNLVFQARALGGQAVWNGRDYRGRQISSGVYLVLISDDTRKDQVATKIVYIKK